MSEEKSTVKKGSPEGQRFFRERGMSFRSSGKHHFPEGKGKGKRL